jgi:hypothetical protein
MLTFSTVQWWWTLHRILFIYRTEVRLMVIKSIFLLVYNASNIGSHGRKLSCTPYMSHTAGKMWFDDVVFSTSVEDNCMCVQESGFNDTSRRRAGFLHCKPSPFGKQFCIANTAILTSYITFQSNQKKIIQPRQMWICEILICTFRQD